jgi:hypothetical protein
VLAWEMLGERSSLDVQRRTKLNETGGFADVVDVQQVASSH